LEERAVVRDRSTILHRLEQDERDAAIRDPPGWRAMQTFACAFPFPMLWQAFSEALRYNEHERTELN
jgi:hypothetical protein